MIPAARIAAAAGVLDQVGAGEPAERALLRWSRGARYAGSGDRAAVRDLVFDALRRRRSYGWLGGGEGGRALMIGRERAAGRDPREAMTGEGHALRPPEATEAGRPLDEAPRGVRLDLPDWLLPRFDASLGAEADPVALALRDRAPLFLRANLARTTREAARDLLAAEGVLAEPHPSVATALRVADGARRIEGARAYREGLVELQDAASQAAVLRLPLRDGDRVLDLCAGGGGKSLALAARARARVFAFDADPRRMADLPARAGRARAEVAVLRDPPSHAPYDLVLVDAPCSGSGTWRRAPDAKWRLTPARLAELAALQGRLLSQAAALVAPGGHLAFATCSVLGEEGVDRVGAFLDEEGPGWRVVDRLRLSPGPDGDGFFQAVLRLRAGTPASPP